jgi:hypothetical protein
MTMKRIEQEAGAELQHAREAISDRTTMRDALKRLFPGGFYFHARGRHSWEITGEAAAPSGSGNTFAGGRLDQLCWSRGTWKGPP